jgi:hypothetical protein
MITHWILLSIQKKLRKNFNGVVLIREYPKLSSYIQVCRNTDVPISKFLPSIHI